MKHFENTENKSIDWYTPKWIFDALDCTFDLDPCSPPGGIPYIPAKKTYSLPEDGLALEWKGNVWCNPPYGKETTKWLKKMHEHRDGIALVFSRTETKWFQEYVAKADAILFLKGRVQFVDARGVTKSSGSTCGSVLVAWDRKNVQILRKLDGRLGYYVENYNR